MISIADNKSEFLDSLFKPLAGGGTFEGYIVRRCKSGPVLFLFGQEYKVNRHGVLCSMRKFEGKKYYFFADFETCDKIGNDAEVRAFCADMLKRNDAK